MSVLNGKFKITTAQRTELTPSIGDGVFVYDNDEKAYYLSNDKAWQRIYTEVPRIQYAKVYDLKASGNSGGTFSSASWRVRTLNTIADYDEIGLTLDSNVFTLPSGKYTLRCTAPAFRVSYHQARLYNVTSASVQEIGDNAFSHAGDSCITMSTIICSFELSSAATFRLEHYSSNTYATTGFGLACNTGVGEMFSQIWITKY